MSFRESLNIGKNNDGSVAVKSEDSYDTSDVSERRHENNIYLATSLLNSKIGTLTALASIHSVNSQRASTGNLSQDQIRRMEANEQQMEQLQEEITELDRSVRTHFSASVHDNGKGK